uniref:Myosin light chain kinase 3 isoform X2 n=1 Tax=Geotrypetes seraphini TaxID=260995 RepID=A0A6P8QU57_GEOSA|nr:myosin light chain kinase 3 isoform X2 [Geotrypetes seraphini]
MGTLYEESSPLHRPICLSTGGFCVADYIERFAIKDKPEVKGAKPKHVLSSRGVQVEVWRTGDDLKKGTKSDGNNEKCEQVKWQTTDISSADSSLTVEERKPELQMVKPEKTNSPKKDMNVKTSKKDSGLPVISDTSRSQKLIIDGEVKPHRSGSEESSNKVAHAKPTEIKNAAPALCTASSETISSKFQCLSRTDGQPLLPRFSSPGQKVDTHEKNQDNMVGDSTKEKAPLCPPAEAQDDGHLQEKLKYKQCHKDLRTDPCREGKDVRSEGKLDPQLIKAGKPQILFYKPSMEKMVMETTEHKSKGLTPPSSMEKGSRSEAAGMGQSFQEPPAARKILENDSDSLITQAETPLSGGMESETKQTTGPSTASETDTVVIDDSPPPPAPFAHRIVSVKPAPVNTCYAICQHEVLGGGRFGQVHKCTEVSTGLSLAAKIIKVKGAKDREEVKNEINIMNQLNHVNLIQLFDAFECKNNITLIVEYVDGGELFDRITDENYNLTELDAILFTKQICEGVYYLHQQYILHLDLKPENILCVNRTGNQIKLIDFGLARRYKPREKLKVNFGTPEFLAPEVVNYDFVSFPTDMWSVGVITYMLLSGLSPFLGENDTETMNFIVNCSWDFDADAFEQVSEEAKDFISQLLVKEKSCRISAAQCLKHKWLNDLPAKAKKFRMRLKSQVLLQSYLAQRKWKKHFYAVTAAYRLRKLQHTGPVNSA